MSRPLLPVPHRTEAFDGACLPACCQMALAFWGVFKSQAEIASQIGHIEGAGTPARHITRLAALGIEVEWSENGTAFENAPIPVPVGYFELAWDEFGRQWAALHCPSGGE